jgi:hypothetical protein
MCFGRPAPFPLLPHPLSPAAATAAQAPPLPLLAPRPAALARAARPPARGPPTERRGRRRPPPRPPHTHVRARPEGRLRLLLAAPPSIVPRRRVPPGGPQARRTTRQPPATPEPAEPALLSHILPPRLGADGRRATALDSLAPHRLRRGREPPPASPPPVLAPRAPGADLARRARGGAAALVVVVPPPPPPPPPAPRVRAQPLRDHAGARQPWPGWSAAKGASGSSGC